MSIKFYNNLSTDSEGYLPLMMSGHLSIESKKIKKNDLLKELNEVFNECWFMYTDKIIINPDKGYDPEKDLLEAEVRTDDSSIHIRYLQNDIYSVTKFYEKTISIGDVEKYAYYDQMISVRQDLQSCSGYKSVKYRLWFCKEDGSGNEVNDNCTQNNSKLVEIVSGRWHSYVQQFLGFSK